MDISLAYALVEIQMVAKEKEWRAKDREILGWIEDVRLGEAELAKLLKERDALIDLLDVIDKRIQAEIG